MCVVSNMGDSYKDRWTNPESPFHVYTQTVTNFPEVTKEEFEALKAEVLQMKKDIAEAKKQDIEEGNPDCEMEDKVAILKRVADAFGVDLSELSK